MSQVIRIPQGLYNKLGEYAKGFETPAQVIERILEHYEGKERVNEKVVSFVSQKRSKDTTKYNFKGNTYGKGRLVHAVVKSYISGNSVNYDELLELFPKHLQGSIGVFNQIEFINNKYANKILKRHYVKPNELIELDNGTTIAVCTEWGIDNIDSFINQAKSLGYQINKET